MTEQAPFFAESGSSPPNIDDPRLPERIREKIRVDPSTGCWLWTAGRDRAGYGQVRLDGRMRQAHRAVYELLVGPAPPGLVLDHAVCDNVACCRTDHLRVTTPGENTRRGWARIRSGHAPSTGEAARRDPAHRARDRRRSERLHAERRCVKCGSVELETKRLCSRCAKEMREYWAHRQAELKASGLCAKGCGRPIAPDSETRCAECLTRHRESTRSRREHGRAERVAAEERAA